METRKIPIRSNSDYGMHTFPCIFYSKNVLKNLSQKKLKKYKKGIKSSPRHSFRHQLCNGAREVLNGLISSYKILIHHLSSTLLHERGGGESRIRFQFKITVVQRNLSFGLMHSPCTIWYFQSKSDVWD
jgi:hypothetical protein